MNSSRPSRRGEDLDWFSKWNAGSFGPRGTGDRKLLAIRLDALLALREIRKKEREVLQSPHDLGIGKQDTHCLSLEFCSCENLVPLGDFPRGTRIGEEVASPKSNKRKKRTTLIPAAVATN